MNKVSTRESFNDNLLNTGVINFRSQIMTNKAESLAIYIRYRNMSELVSLFNLL